MPSRYLRAAKGDVAGATELYRKFLEFRTQETFLGRTVDVLREEVIGLSREESARQTLSGGSGSSLCISRCSR